MDCVDFMDAIRPTQHDALFLFRKRDKRKKMHFTYAWWHQNLKDPIIRDNRDIPEKKDN